MDTVSKYVPWLHIANVPPPPLTVAEQIVQINAIEDSLGINFKDNPFAVSELYCVDAFRFVPKGPGGCDSVCDRCIGLDLDTMTDGINSGMLYTKCGGIAHYAMELIKRGNPGVQTAGFNFGDEVNGPNHAVALWKIGGKYYYYDGLNGATLTDTSGNPISLRNALLLVARGYPEKVNYRTIPRWFGPDRTVQDPTQIGRSFTYDSILAKTLWNLIYSVPLDSALFCSANIPNSLGIYLGTTWDKWLQTGFSRFSGLNTLDSIENKGFPRDIHYWWFWNPNTPDTALQSWIDSIQDRYFGGHPVLWLQQLSATTHRMTVSLSWQTEQELDNVGFTIERSSDGILFQSIAWINGLGSSRTGISYQYIDKPPVAGRYYYRLEQKTADGGVSFSTIASAVIGRSAPMQQVPLLRFPLRVQLWPNPAAAQLNISVNMTTVAEIFNRFGLLVQSVSCTPETVTSIDVSGWHSGMYFIRFPTGQAYRLVVIH